MTEPLENVRVGMTGRHEVVVTRELTVGAVLDGMPFVFGTPMMILAMEMASAAAAAPHLPSGWVTVGSEVNVRHLAPTPVGRTVVATARVVEVSGRSMLFEVEAHDGVRKIGAGTHRRSAVNLEPRSIPRRSKGVLPDVLWTAADTTSGRVSRRRDKLRWSRPLISARNGGRQSAMGKFRGNLIVAGERREA
jgi:fluoroacetyl-CoA thioesterase